MVFIRRDSEEGTTPAMVREVLMDEINSDGRPQWQTVPTTFRGGKTQYCETTNKNILAEAKGDVQAARPVVKFTVCENDLKVMGMKGKFFRAHPKLRDGQTPEDWLKVMKDSKLYVAKVEQGAARLGGEGDYRMILDVDMEADATYRSGDAVTALVDAEAAAFHAICAGQEGLVVMATTTKVVVDFDGHLVQYKNDVDLGQQIQKMSQKVYVKVMNLNNSDIDGRIDLSVLVMARDYLSRLQATMKIASGEEHVDEGLMKMVLQPNRPQPSTLELTSVPNISPECPCNPSQERAIVDGTENKLSCVQGPPGTGKSTTIATTLGAIAHHHGSDCATTVTCVTNQAIDAVMEKLQHKEGMLCGACKYARVRKICLS